MKDLKKIIYIFSAVILVIVVFFVWRSFAKNLVAPQNANVAGAAENIISNVAPNVPAPLIENRISIVIGGDVMFDRNIRVRGEKNGYEQFFANLKDFFTNADLAVVNLEGPVTNNKSKTILDDGSYSGDLKFTFATSTAKTLKDIGIDIVSLANNHTDNTGYKGFNETKKWLSFNDLKYFGDPWNSSSTEAVVEIKGMKIAFVGYHYFLRGLDTILADVTRLKQQGYFVIVIPHWGEEYKTHHLPIMEEIAHKFVDAGADAIIGSHPHVIMDHEWIGDVPVFYSLGNLLFDQYFSPAVQKGNIVRLNLKQVGFGAKIESLEIFDIYDSQKEGIKFDEASSTLEMAR